MSKANYLFKPLALFAALNLTFSAVPGVCAETVQFKKQEGGFYKDVFDQNLFYEGTNVLHLDRFYRLIFDKKPGSSNVNVYDEVPDSIFFTNRHGKERMTESALWAGACGKESPDFSGQILVTQGKAEGMHPGFFVRDGRGDSYLLKFDPLDNYEMATSAEIIASRFYHAIGYNVPQYTIEKLDPANLVPGEGASIVDHSGFQKRLSSEKLQEYLMFLPQDSEGYLRASASKILPGESLGYFSFHGRRSDDPRDTVEHRNLREIRALWVFASWLNNYDVRESNTLSMAVDHNGEKHLQYYIIDFNSALGSAAQGAKPPMFSHEHFFDFGEAAKALLSFGWWVKPWQKRWDQTGGKYPHSPAVGYFDNRYFDPGKFKTQLPYYAFKDVSRGDGFWAAKIIMSFSDADIRALVNAGKLTDSRDEDYLAGTLMERRDMIGRYWFSRVNPLDRFDVQNGTLVFDDLAVRYGFEDDSGKSYAVDVFPAENGNEKKIASLTVSEPKISLQASWFETAGEVDLRIRTRRGASGPLSPVVTVRVSSQSVLKIRH